MTERPHAARGWLRLLSALCIPTAILTVSASALGPHEIVVLVNANSGDSMHVANHFINLRRVPPQNVVYLSLPDTVLEPGASISRADFTNLIWEPANRIIRQRGIEDHVLAWVYSAGFPVRIAGPPGLSIQGLTFLRNKVPDAKDVQMGTYRSRIFAGPDAPRGERGPSMSLENFTLILGDEYPLPSMMLGVAGSRGNEPQRIVECIGIGAGSDHQRMTGTVFFVVGKDVRSTCREWQYGESQRELNALGIESAVVTQVPANARIAGLMMGSPSVPASTFSGPVTYAPGAMCEHLTSAAAIFDDPNQTKLTHWIQHGATASAGTVIEPYALWVKFPSARFYAHLASGCTMLESFFLSIRCPLQTLLVGEPLAQPGAPALQVSLELNPISPTQTLVRASVAPGNADKDSRYMFFLDGQTLEHPDFGPDASLDPSTLSEGYHDLRVVLYRDGTVRHQAFAETNIVVPGRAGLMTLSGISPGEAIDANRIRSLKVTARGNPREVFILHNERPVCRADEDGSAALNPAALGTGPHRIHPAAIFAGGHLVRGRPIDFLVEDMAKPPRIQEVAAERSATGVVFAVQASDPNGYETSIDWFQPVKLAETAFTPLEPAVSIIGGRIEETAEGARLDPEREYAVALIRQGTKATPREFLLDIAISPGRWSALHSQMAGIVFDYSDRDNFSYFALRGRDSAWVIGRRRKGEWETHASRGRFIRPERWYSMSVRQTKHGVVGRVNDEDVVLWEGGRMGSGPAGVIAAGSPAYFRNAGINPPQCEGYRFSAAGDHMRMEPSPALPFELVVRVRNLSKSAFRTVKTGTP